MKKQKIIVLDPYSLERLGIVSKYTSLVFKRKNANIGEFEFWCDSNDNNNELAKKDNLIYLSKERVGIIKYIKVSVDEDGVRQLHVKGKTLEYYLTYRIILNTFEVKNKCISDIMLTLLNDNFINPNDKNRKMPFLKVSEDYRENIGKVISMQKTGGEVADVIINLAQTYNMHFCLMLDLESKSILFKVKENTDRTISQDKNEPVSICTDLKDIMKSEYVCNALSSKNIALIAGAGEGKRRKKVIIGEIEESGIDRKEMYVDARDISSTTTDDTGVQQEMPLEEYNKLLEERGTIKLNEQKVIENFDASVLTSGNANYIFEEDYFLGDTVTIIDKNIGVESSAVVSEVEEIFSGTDGYSLNIVFGYGQPTLSEKIKKMQNSSSNSTSVSYLEKYINDIEKPAAITTNDIYEICKI